MEVQKGDIVRSINGRDRDRALFVLEVDGDYLVLIDGKSRRLEHPKRKKKKHCTFLSREESRVAEKLRSGEKVGNSEVRRALAAIEAAAKQEPAVTGGGL